MVELISISKTIIVFKTDIDLVLEQEIRNLLTDFEEIYTIDFDFEDCDNILIIEAKADISSSIIKILNAYGYYCEELP